jgi:hypothetical protein
MNSEIQQTHLLERTSPKGEDFIGTCQLCGKTGLRANAIFKFCENPGRVPSDEAVLIAIEGDEDELCTDYRRGT